MKRSKHSLSHYSLLSAAFGKIIPLTWYEALPGDTIRQASSLLLRMLPLVAPVMHPVRIRIHSFFVPNRLIWDDFEKFITGDDGYTEYGHPNIIFNSEVSKGTLADYLGIPTLDYTSAPLTVSALPFRAYNLIWNEHYRDQDIISERDIDTSNGNDTTTPVELMYCAWEKDYFTTARATEQKGPSPVIPISGDAPVVGIGKVDRNFPTASKAVWETDGTSQTTYANSDILDATGDFWVQGTEATGGLPQIYADLSAATGITVNELRESLALQRFMENRQNYGSRYVEYLRSLGVRSSDGRLDIPEYLGGGAQMVSFSEILQTQRTDADQTPLGTMAGHGIAALRTRRWKRFFEEHGIVMTLMSIVPKSIYSTALHRKWSRFDNMAYFQKELQFLGDQQVFNREVQVEHTNRDQRFGYQQRYDDYRSLPSLVHADMRDTLNYWHMAREFSGDVALNSSFIQCVPTTRISADTASDPAVLMCNHSIQARRILSRNPRPRTF